MRHAYVGDVGDFGKYGLLRAFGRSEPSHRLGVVWYLTDDPEHGNDGRHDGYLKNGSVRYRESFRRCDRDLYEAMTRIRSNSKLNIHLIQKHNVLPDGTRYYNRALPICRLNGVNRTSLLQQWLVRERWHANALETVADAQYVFVDPDNGVLFPTGENNVRLVKPSRKHSYWHELDELLDRGKSVVAYHHLGRQRGGHLEQISTSLDRIRRFGHEAKAIHYRRGSARAFVIIPATDEHRRWLFQAAQLFATNWAAHCALVTAR